MTERPILFSAPMVRALLAGTKTQTRRVARIPADATRVQYWAPPSGRSEPGYADPGVNYWTPSLCVADDDDEDLPLSNHLDRCPYGQPGDRLWVRETWQAVNGNDRARHIVTHPAPDRGWIEYAATPRADEPAYKWRPSIHMPRWASRITLEVTGVRVERLQEISRGAAMAEGCPFPNMAKGDDPRKWYAGLWEQINGPGSWDANPWVWVVEFKKVAP